ncbi:hypothetical protein Scep_029424 [Stephania cephalantha]|uniref:F-box domain-containing protein n=1 Tax=Stephania cephalantha TaxID=152367 RepID=A0AAP0E0Y8_9MAGN
MALLGLDLMLKVLDRLDARSLALCLMVSRDWNRVASTLVYQERGRDDYYMMVNDNGGDLQHLLAIDVERVMYAENQVKGSGGFHFERIPGVWKPGEMKWGTHRKDLGAYAGKPGERKWGFHRKDPGVWKPGERKWGTHRKDLGVRLADGLESWLCNFVSGAIFSALERSWFGKAHIPRVSQVRGVSKLVAYSLSIIDGKRVSV